MVVKTYRTRTELIEILIKRDGTACQHPDHKHELDFDVRDGPQMVTIDHWFPQSWCREQGWTDEQIWHPDNLKLFCKKGNAAKGDLLPNPDGTLPPRAPNTFKYRRQKRAERPEVCTSCNAGRNLQENEFCNSCGSGPMPLRFPKWRQMSTKDCDHDLFYCVACTVWFPERRRSVLNTLITGGEGYE